MLLLHAAVVRIPGRPPFLTAFCVNNCRRCLEGTPQNEHAKPKSKTRRPYNGYTDTAIKRLFDSKSVSRRSNAAVLDPQDSSEDHSHSPSASIDPDPDQIMAVNFLVSLN